MAEDEVARLTFLGAAGEVTGSCTLVETAAASVLVDCGMNQGGRGAEARNRRRFAFDPAGIDAVVLTHAHIDHSGLLPRLVRDGFRGAIHVTRPTAGLLDIMLLDSAHIHEQDAKQATRKALRRGRPAVQPLYTTEDARRALGALVGHRFDEEVEVADGVRVRFRRAGHILGAASVELRARRGTVERHAVFSGDVGRASVPGLLDPDPPAEADFVVLEATYGDREHKDLDASLDELAEILERAGEAGENVIVPVFAVGRAQELLYHLGRFERTRRVRPRPIFLDSPMAISVTELHLQHPECFEGPIRDALERGELEPAHLAFCRTPQESMALNERRGIVILAASGMCEAGRVVHHLKHNLWREGAHVVIVGFQAAGTTGRALVDGARKVRILGEEIAVRAHVHTVGGFSAHAGQRELCEWVGPLLDSGAHLALNHGEPEARGALAAQLTNRSRHPILLPELGDVATLRLRGEPVHA